MIGYSRALYRTMGPNEVQGSNRQSQSVQFHSLIVFKDPLVVLTGLCFLFRRHFGQSKNLANLFGILSSQLEGNLEARQIQKFLDPHEIGGGEQIKKHVSTSQFGIVHKLLVPFLVHDLRSGTQKKDMSKKIEYCSNSNTLAHCLTSLNDDPPSGVGISFMGSSW